MTYFFTRFIVINQLIEELDTIDLSNEEKTHLSGLIDSSIHHAILDEILSNLNEEDKKIFLKKLHEKTSDDEILEFLNQKVENIEEKIKNVTKELVKEMHKDIKQAKKIKND